MPEQSEMPDQLFRCNTTFLTKNMTILGKGTRCIQNGRLETFEKVKAVGIGAVQPFITPTVSESVPLTQLARLPCFIGIKMANACGRIQIHQKHEQMRKDANGSCRRI